MSVRLASYVLAAAVLADASGALAQPDVSATQLRQFNAEQKLELERRQDGIRASLKDLAPANREPLRIRLDRQQFDQHQLQQRQLRQQRALKQRLKTMPAPGPTSPLSLQLKGFKREQRNQQLRFGVQRRSWSRLRD